jgi:hypothetical protein
MKTLDSLNEEFPEAFDGPFSFECQDGWYALIQPVIAEIARYNKEQDEENRCYPVQIKEKWGTLNIYMNAVPELLEFLIEAAELLSAKRCEVCGEPGKVYRNSWHVTRCLEHIK